MTEPEPSSLDAYVRRVMAHGKNHVVISSGPALRPGEIRLERFIEQVDERPESYRMSVVDVR